MACNCSKSRRAETAGPAAPAGTYRVMVRGRKVYESTDGQKAGAVAARFDAATVLAPGEDA